MPDLIDEGESAGEAEPYEYMDDLFLGRTLDNILDSITPIPIDNFTLPPNVTVRRRLNFDDDDNLGVEIFNLLNSPRVTSTASV